MLYFHVLLLSIVNAIPAFAVEPKKITTVISEDSNKHNLFSNQRAVQEEPVCTDDPPDWEIESYDYYYDCDYFQQAIDVKNYDRDFACLHRFIAQITDPDNGLMARDACCVCGGGKIEEPEQESNWFITYVDSLLSDNVLVSTYNTKSGVGSDYSMSFTDGTCASGGPLHDGSVIIATAATNAADDTLVITKTINAASIAKQHGGNFIFCETVALTDTGVVETYDVVYAMTQYTIAANFLADVNGFISTLQDDTAITEENADLSLAGTVVATRCGGVSENLNPGDTLCLEISQTDLTDIGVESIHNLNLNQGLSTFTAIKDDVNQHPNLVVPACADGACTVDITVPSFMYEDSSGAGAATVTMDVSGNVYLYDKSSKNGKAESHSFSHSVKLEKPCEGGLYGNVVKMFSK